MQCQITRPFGPVAGVEGLLDDGRQFAPGCVRPATGTARRGRGRAARAGDAQLDWPLGLAIRRSIDKHAVDHLLDHQPIQLSLLTRQFEAATRGLLLAGQAPGQLASQQRDDKESDTGQTGGRHRGRHIAQAVARAPSRHEQHQRHRRGRGQCWHACGQHAGHQHRQDEQRDVVERRARVECVQCRERQQVKADGGQPLTAAEPRVRVGAGTKARQQPERQGLRCIEHAHRHRQGRTHAEDIANELCEQERQAEHRPCTDEDPIQALERAAAGRDDAARLARQEAAVGRQRSFSPRRRGTRPLRIDSAHRRAPRCRVRHSWHRTATRPSLLPTTSHCRAALCDARLAGVRALHPQSLQRRSSRRHGARGPASRCAALQ